MPLIAYLQAKYYLIYNILKCVTCVLVVSKGCHLMLLRQESMKLLVMKEVPVSLDVDNNTLSSMGKRVTLKHHQTAAFLAALVHRAEHASSSNEKQLCMAAMSAIWNDQSGTCEPDRTAMRRLLQSVDAGLAAVRSASRVMSLPRKATVGP